MISQVDDEVGFIRFFRALPVKEDETIRIFDRGDWYTSHGDDAAFIARTVEWPDADFLLKATNTFSRSTKRHLSSVSSVRQTMDSHQ